MGTEGDKSQRMTEYQGVRTPYPWPQKLDEVISIHFQILLDLSERQWVDNKPRWFTLQDQPANASHEAFSPRMLSPVASNSQLSRGGGGGGTPSPKNRSRSQGSPRRSRTPSGTTHSSRSSGYEYSDSDRLSYNSKSGYQGKMSGLIDTYQ